MVAHMTKNYPSKFAVESRIARCLNQLTVLNMHNYGSPSDLEDIISDYFVSRPLGRLEEDSESSEDTDSEKT